MPAYEEERGEQEVPKAVGVAGYLAILKRLLELPRVQKVEITPGKITYLRFRKQGDPEREFSVDLSTLMPHAVVRSKELLELTPISDNAAVVMAQIFSQVHMDGLNPANIITGTQPNFRQWHADSTGVILPADEAYGLPILPDPQIPGEALIVGAAYGKRASLVDTIRLYKVTMPLLRSK